MCQGAVPALFPFLISQRGLSFGATSGLLVTMTVCSSVLQPLFGLVADRSSRSFFMPLGLVLAGAGVAVCGAVSSYGVELAAVAVGGLGVGLFHPDAARRARAAAGARVATGFSLFSVGGNAGFALAPIVVTPAVLLFGLPGAIVVLVPCLACAALLALHPPALRRPSAQHADAPPEPDRWGAFSKIGAIAALRSGVYFGMQAFLAGYFVQYLGTSDGAANAALAALLTAGALGTLVGGRLADRVDPRLVLLGSMVLQPLLLALLLSVDSALAAALVAAAARLRHGGDVQRHRGDGPGLPAVAAGPRLRRHARAGDRRRRPDRGAAGAGRGRGRHPHRALAARAAAATGRAAGGAAAEPGRRAPRRRARRAGRLSATLTLGPSEETLGP